MRPRRKCRAMNMPARADSGEFAIPRSEGPAVPTAHADGGAACGGPAAYDYQGGCLCGCVRLSYRTPRAVVDWPLRTCGCHFCRRHGAVFTFDAAGTARLDTLTPDSVRCHRVGQRSIGFLVCSRCGTLVMAATDTVVGPRAIVNVRALYGIGVDASRASSLAHDATTSLQARSRAQLLWAPLMVHGEANFADTAALRAIRDVAVPAAPRWNEEFA